MKAKDPTIRIFWIALAVHVIAWTLLCWFTQPNLPLDMIEMTFWGQQWQWGYHKHPPLPAWIAATVWSAGGHNPLWMYLTSQLTIAVTFWAVWQMAREGLNPWLALCAVGILQACYYCTYSINDINNTIVTRPFWCLAILFFFRATKPESKNPTLWWSLTGVVIGLGMLSKYYLGVLVLVMMAVPLLIRSTRKLFATPGPWLMTAISLAIFSPHLMWMVENDFVTIRYVVDRGTETSEFSLLSHAVSPFKFVFSQAGAWIPMLLVSIPLISFSGIGKSLLEMIKGNREDYFQRFLAIVVCGPILFYLLAAGLTGANIRSMWGGPLFCFFGVFLFALSRDAAGGFLFTPRVDQGLRNCSIAAVVMLLGLFCRNGLGPLVRDDFSRVHFPGQSVCEEVHRRWNDRVDVPLTIVGGEMFTAGCVGVYSSHHVDVFAGVSLEANPWVDDAIVSQHGGILVWDMDEIGDNPPVDWVTRFEHARIMKPFECPAGGLAADRNARVGMIFIPPRELSARTARTARSIVGKR